MFSQFSKTTKETRARRQTDRQTDRQREREFTTSTRTLSSSSCDDYDAQQNSTAKAYIKLIIVSSYFCRSFSILYYNLMRKKREEQTKREIFFCKELHQTTTKIHKKNHQTHHTRNNNETLFFFFFFFFFFARGVQKLLSLTRIGVHVIFYHRFCESL